MGKGKLLKFKEIETFEHVIQVPFFSISNQEFYLKGRWAEGFFRNQNSIIIELGCGKGEYTVELAKRFPEINFIGVDIKGARIWKGAKQVLELGLTNVAFLRTGIERIDAFFGIGEVSEIWLTFPDPQMKKSRKRLTSSGFLARYRLFLKPNGIIHLKTDSHFQYTYTSEIAKLNHFEVIAETSDLYQSALLNETLGIKTFYEKQWLNRGLSIKYIAFRLNDAEIKEPEIEIEKDNYRSFARNAKE
jgi:tRNA (guanine-N7-)-methyltransferase